MCGYFGNLHECPAVLALMLELDIPLPLPKERAYQRSPFSALITADQEGANLSEALWWFALKEQDGKLQPNEKVTSFNARDLAKPLWQKATKTSRGLIFATELGESKGKDRFLMRSKEGFALGCLYKDWQTPGGKILRSFAVITRPPHPRFSRYHDKSIPLFLPLDSQKLKTWLDPSIQTSEEINHLLDNPKLRTDLEVSKVKTYKNGEALGEPEFLEKD